jgi:hypothetical protein
MQRVWKPVHLPAQPSTRRLIPGDGDDIWIGCNTATVLKGRIDLTPVS